MTSALENIKTIKIDQWLTLATAPSPTKLQPGQTPFMFNTWVDEKPGSVITANGYRKVGALPSGNPGTFCINYFKTSAGTQTFVVSDNGTVWTTVDFQSFTAIITGLSTSFQLRGLVIRDKLWLTNGNDAVRTFDGTTVTVLDGSTHGSLIVQDLTYTANPSGGVSPPQITIAYTTGGSAGAEVVTVTGSAISVKIQSGVSTATQIQTAINASSAALALVSVAVSGAGGNAQTAPYGPTGLAGGVPNVPKGRYLAYHDERVWIGHISSARSQVFFAALSDTQGNIIAPDDPAAWPSANFLQVSEGDADYLTGMILYRGYLHFFKQYTIWRLVGYDEYTYTRVKTRASTGTRFNESLQILDSLIHMIGIDGIYVFDGEETERISDIIDPSTAEQTAFGFNQLQQPNTNNLFFEVASTSDFNAGTPSRNLSIANNAAEKKSDDTQADFQAGNTLTNVTAVDAPGFLQLSHTNSGKAATNVALNLPVALGPGVVTPLLGLLIYLTDGNLTNAVGFSGGTGSAGGSFDISGLPAINLTTVILRGLTVSAGGSLLQFTQIVGSTRTALTISATTYGTITGGNILSVPATSTPTDVTVTLATWTSGGLNFSSTNNFTVTELEVYAALFNTSGQFISQTLDLGTTPASLGNFYASFVANGETLTFQTQSSADGASWDAAVAVTNGGAIGSTVRRYLRWIANFASDGLNTPVIDFVYLPAVYQSAVHDTGGNIFAWGAFESNYALNGQVINFYYRGATTSGGVASASWIQIVPGGAVNMPVANRFIQFKLEFSGFTAGNAPPEVDSVTINWVVGSASAPQVLQNVASFFWKNRYWLSAAGAGALSNNTILIRGKKTFGSPWQLKDWTMLSFCRYLDNLYGTDSTNANIYQLDTGYSKNGAAINAIFETGDFTFEGFQVVIRELVIETERLGPYTLLVGHSTDQGQNWKDHSIDLTPVVSGTTSFWKRINNLNLTTDKIRLRFYINSVDQPFQVHNCIIYYQMSSQRATVGVN